MRKTLAIIFGVLFVVFAAVQYNDPDPEVWIPIYLVAVVASWMFYAQMGKPWLFVGVAIGYAIAAAYQWPPAFEGFLLNEMGMKTINIELARESGGLALCAIVMGIFAWMSKR